MNKSSGKSKKEAQVGTGTMAKLVKNIIKSKLIKNVEITQKMKMPKRAQQNLL